jgi:hypothetical protein
VRHRDLVALHVEQVTADAAASGLEMDPRSADARRRDLEDESADAVLLLGPRYHQVVLDARGIERIPELLGLSPHLLATARRHRFVLGEPIR